MIDFDSDSVLLDTFYNYMLIERGLSKNTIDSYARDITKFSNFIYDTISKSLTECVNKDLLLFLAQLKEKELFIKINSEECFINKIFLPVSA